jgi:hypothetical protein
MLTAKKGISALQIHRIMFGAKSTHAYHTSWYICMRWRAAMAGDMYQPLSGVSPSFLMRELSVVGFIRSSSAAPPAP